MDTESGSEIVGIVPAAGAGSRLAPYPGSKELFPIGHQTLDIGGSAEERPKVISQYLLENMMSAGVRKYYFIISHGKYDIVSYYGNGNSFGVNISYLYQARLAGMPYAVDLATPWLAEDATVVMGMPDTVIEPPGAFRLLVAAHRNWQADLTLGLFHTDRPYKFGMVGIDTDANVVEHIDKPRVTTHLTWLWGMACWGPRFTRLMHTALSEQSMRGTPERETVLGAMFDRAIASGLVVKGVPFEEGQYIDIGTYDDLRRALLLYA